MIANCDNSFNFTSHFIKSFPENINFANTISNCLMPEECTLLQISWKVEFTPLIMGSMMETFLRLVNGNNNHNKIITLHIKYVKMV